MMDPSRDGATDSPAMRNTDITSGIFIKTEIKVKSIKMAATVGLIIPISAIAGSKLDNIFDPEMIGANSSYLEKYTGPARNTYKHNDEIHSTYKVDGCEVKVIIQNKTVSSIGLPNLSSKCTFDLSKFLPNISKKLLSANTLTFGLIDGYFGGGKYGASCLLSCGNAADPDAYLEVDASRADGGYHITIGVILAGAALDASNKWQDVMIKNEGEDWVINTEFNGTKKYDAIASKVFKNIKINSISIGYK